MCTSCAQSSPPPPWSPSWSWSLPALVKRSEKQSWWDFAFWQMKSQVLYVWFVWFSIWKVKSQDWYVWSVGFCMPANWQTWLGSASWASLNYLHWASHRQCLGKLTIITIIIIIIITVITIAIVLISSSSLSSLLSLYSYPHHHRHHYFHCTHDHHHHRHHFCHCTHDHHHHRHHYFHDLYLPRYDWMRNEPNDWHGQNCLTFLKWGVSVMIVIENIIMFVIIKIILKMMTWRVFHRQDPVGFGIYHWNDWDCKQLARCKTKQTKCTSEIN